MISKLFNFEKMRIPLVYALYLIAAMVLQSLLFSGLSILGAKGFILPGAVVAAGMYLGGVGGALFGLCLGVLADLSFTDATVLYTVLFSATGFTVGFASEFYINKSFLAFMLFSVIALIITGFAQLLCAMILHGAGLLSGLWMILRQTLVSIPPVMLLYIPFRNRN